MCSVKIRCSYNFCEIDSLRPAILLKKQTLAQVSSCEFRNIFIEHPWWLFMKIHVQSLTKITSSYLLVKCKITSAGHKNYILKVRSSGIKTLQRWPFGSRSWITIVFKTTIHLIYFLLQFLLQRKSRKPAPLGSTTSSWSNLQRKSI